MVSALARTVISLTTAATAQIVSHARITVNHAFLQIFVYLAQRMLTSYKTNASALMDTIPTSIQSPTLWSVKNVTPPAENALVAVHARIVRSVSNTVRSPRNQHRVD
jgi:hypothetical protein